MRRIVCVGAAGLALGIAGCGGSSHASSAAAGSHASAPGSAASAPGGSSTTASASASAPASKPAHGVKPRRRYVYNRPAQVVSGTGGVVVPAAHITIGVAAPLASASFVSRADAVCRDYRAEVAHDGGASTLTEQEKVYTSVVDDATHAIVRLQDLSPPAPARPLFLRYLALTGGAIDDFAIAQRRSRSTSEKDGTAVAGRDFSVFQVLARRVTAARLVAHKLGLRVCGSAGSDWL